MRGPYRQLDTRAQKPEPNNAIHEFAKCKPSASRAPHAQIPLANPQHSNTIHELAEDISASPARPRSPAEAGRSSNPFENLRAWIARHGNRQGGKASAKPFMER